MAVKLKGSCPPMEEVLKLGSECGLVYGLMWEGAYKDSCKSFGGTTSWSVKGIADVCSIGKATVIRGLKKLMDAGFIQHEGHRGSCGSKVKVWRVTHPKQLKAARHAIALMGPPSARYLSVKREEAEGIEEMQQGVEYDLPKA